MPDKILYTGGPNPFKGLIGMPEFPFDVLCTKQCDNGPCDCEPKLMGYRKQVESIKSNAPDIVNTQDVEDALSMHKGYFECILLNSGDIFDLPNGYSFEKGGRCEGCIRAGMWHCAHADTCGNAIDVLRIVKTEVKGEECFVHVFPDKFDSDGRKYCVNCGTMSGESQPSPEESQKELLQALITTWNLTPDETVLKHFLIHRKK